MKVTLNEPGLAGDYIVAERKPDGTLLLAPDTSIEAIRKRAGTRQMSPEEFERHFGDLSSRRRGVAHGRQAPVLGALRRGGVHRGP